MATQHLSKSTIDRETDARFWAQTQYRVGQKLDPTDPSDRRMMKIWLDIYAKVKREDDAGRMVVTYDHPVVERSLDDATIATHAATGHLDAASGEPDPTLAQAHVDAATDALSAASAAAHRAASVQPASVSTVIADAVAAQAAAAARLEPPVPVTSTLPSDHPAVSSPAAQPAIHPDVVIDPGRSMVSDPAAAFAAAFPSMIPPPGSTQDPGPAQPPGPALDAGPITTADHLAISQSIAAPQVAARVHQDAQDRADRGEKPAEGTLHPRTVGSIRALAMRLAQDSRGDFVGVHYPPDEKWSVPLFQSPREMEDWYGHLADTPDMFRYVAYFNKQDPAWPAAVNEVFGSGQAIGVSVRLDRPTGPGQSVAPTTDGSSRGRIIAIGAAILVGVGVLVAATSSRRSGGWGTRSGSGAQAGTSDVVLLTPSMRRRRS